MFFQTQAVEGFISVLTPTVSYAVSRTIASLEKNLILEMFLSDPKHIRKSQSLLTAILCNFPLVLYKEIKRNGLCPLMMSSE